MLCVFGAPVLTSLLLHTPAIHRWHESEGPGRDFSIQIKVLRSFFKSLLLWLQKILREKHKTM